jgi:surface antigen
MKLRPLASLELELAMERVFILGTTPKGNRMIAEIKGAELIGSRVKASMKGLAAADWAVLGDDGLARFDIRMVLETNDDALIYLSYTGKADWSAGPGSGPIFSVAEFETADDRYMSASKTNCCPLMKPTRSAAMASVAERLGRNPNEQGKKSASKIGSRTSLAACWHTRSVTVGMPNGRLDPSGFGISTRRTGAGR